jgi:hypothetical protein
VEMRRSRPHPARMRSERPRASSAQVGPVDADVRSPEADDVAGGNPLHGLTVRPADQGAAVTSTRAGQNERDHRALLDAIAKGHVDAVAGI